MSDTVHNSSGVAKGGQGGQSPGTAECRGPKSYEQFKKNSITVYFIATYLFAR